MKCAPDTGPNMRISDGEPEDGRRAVLQQLQADVVRRQPLRRDARPDDDGDEQAGAEELGEEAARQGRRRGRGHAAILTRRERLSQT